MCNRSGRQRHWVRAAGRHFALSPFSSHSLGLCLRAHPHLARASASLRKGSSAVASRGAPKPLHFLSTAHLTNGNTLVPIARTRADLFSLPLASGGFVATKGEVMQDTQYPKPRSPLPKAGLPLSITFCEGYKKTGKSLARFLTAQSRLRNNFRQMKPTS